MSSQVSGKLIVKLLILLALISILRQEERELLSERFFFYTFCCWWGNYPGIKWGIKFVWSSCYLLLAHSCKHCLLPRAAERNASSSSHLYVILGVQGYHYNELILSVYSVLCFIQGYNPAWLCICSRTSYLITLYVKKFPLCHRFCDPKFRFVPVVMETLWVLPPITCKNVLFW